MFTQRRLSDDGAAVEAVHIRLEAAARGMTVDDYLKRRSPHTAIYYQAGAAMLDRGAVVNRQHFTAWDDAYKAVQATPGRKYFLMELDGYSLYTVSHTTEAGS